jgi:tetratricopeptide (TPR) repeat protein
MRFWFLLLAWVTVALPAYAQSDDERARMHFEAGRSYYDQARYDDASREFQQAFDLSGRNEMLLNLSQAQERALRYDDAISSARRYLELEPDAKDRKTVEDRIVNLQQLKQRFATGGPSPLPAPGETDAAIGPTGTPAEPGTTPGTAEPVAPPSAATLGGEPSPAPTAATRPDTDDTNRFTIPAIVLMGTGGAALVASLVTGLVAHADYKSLQRRCKPNGDCPPSAKDELDEGETLSVVSTVLTVVGVLAAGTGGALLIIGANEEHEPAAARPGQLAIAPGPTPLSVGASLSF